MEVGIKKLILPMISLEGGGRDKEGGIKKLPMIGLEGGGRDTETHTPYDQFGGWGEG